MSSLSNNLLHKNMGTYENYFYLIFDLIFIKISMVEYIQIYNTECIMHFIYEFKLLNHKYVFESRKINYRKNYES